MTIFAWFDSLHFFPRDTAIAYVSRYKDWTLMIAMSIQYIKCLRKALRRFKLYLRRFCRGVVF